MGPSILFDKSAIQSLGKEAIHEVSRYFYTVVPPVLLMETLADLSLNPNDLTAAKKKVADISRKVFPIDSIANAHFQTMCIQNLLGDHVPMDRRPAVAGGKFVTAKDGSKGVFIDIQSESEAVHRWRNGNFNEADLKFAIDWRSNAKGSNLEAMKKLLSKPPIKIQSALQVAVFVDLMFAQPDFQEPLLRWFLNLLRCDEETTKRICLRWKWAVVRSLKSFAPFAHHCLRVQLIFYTGMIQGIFGTRPSNIVDLEYLCYTPFANVFCSGDKLHEQMAPLILQSDQSFLRRDELQSSLAELTKARNGNPDSEPEDESLVRELWLKHWKRPPTKPSTQTHSKEDTKRIMDSLRPIIQAIREQECVPLPRFPV